jgi:hypothetical protein
MRRVGTMVRAGDRILEHVFDRAPDAPPHFVILLTQRVSDG